MLLFLIAYLAGALTIVSPCILPVLPFVLSRAGQPFARSILPMLVGMIVTFAGVATLAAVGGSWAVHANEIGRYAAIALIAGFGVTLLSPRIAAVVTRPAVALGSRLSQQASGKGGVSTSFLLGVATGLLWAPCAGPILGLVLTGAALQGANVQTTLLLTAYAAGAATSLAMAVLAGEKVFAAMKRSLGVGERLRQGLGIAVLAGVTAIALGLDTGLLSRLSYASSAGIEQSLLDKLHGSSGVAEPGGNAMQLAANDARKGYQSDLPVLGRLQSLDGAVEWLNSKPLTAEELRGKVVLVDFWTYSCINCIRTIPYVRAWAEKYRDQGLVVIGVHSPEFAFEKRIDNVRQAIDKFQIGYPVAIDNNFKIWRSFANNYWPAHYFIDAKGQIRHTQFGEGDYEQSERVIQICWPKQQVARRQMRPPSRLTPRVPRRRPTLPDCSRENPTSAISELPTSSRRKESRQMPLATTPSVSRASTNGGLPESGPSAESRPHSIRLAAASHIGSVPEISIWSSDPGRTARRSAFR